MRKSLLLLFAFITILSCTNENETLDEIIDPIETVDQTTDPITPPAEPTEPTEPAQENLMTGDWKLIYIYTPFSGNQVTDYSSEEIVYKFNENGILEVSGDNLIHLTGEYEYTFDLESVSGTPNNDPLSLITTIEGNRFMYQERTDGLIRLSLSYMDGRDLFLEPIE